jgi:hypothetical protein
MLQHQRAAHKTVFWVASRIACLHSQKGGVARVSASIPEVLNANRDSVFTSHGTFPHAIKGPHLHKSLQSLMKMKDCVSTSHKPSAGPPGEVIPLWPRWKWLQGHLKLTVAC